jgi:dihydroneopterin aldolase
MSSYSTLFVRGLKFSGVLGSTGREPTDRQLVQVDLHLTIDTTVSAQSDKLKDTYDYKEAIEVARSVIEDERHVLIEKIADIIARRICMSPMVRAVKVKIQKLEGAENGVPGIVTVRRRVPQDISFELLPLDMRSVIAKLETDGGVSIPILPDAYRHTLLNEAETYTYVKQPEIVGPAKVREQISSTKDFRPGSLFFQLKDTLEEMIKRQMNNLPDNTFPTPLSFNEMSLQLYEKGSIGITPHRDGLSRINMICVFVLTGTSKFALCDDREGSNPRYLDTTPGNLIILRAPGLMGAEDSRPMHFVSDITERRIVFGLRQHVPKK